MPRWNDGGGLMEEQLNAILDRIKGIMQTLDEIIDGGEMSSDMWDLLVFQFREMKKSISEVKS